MNSWRENLIASEDANTFLADQWMSYVRIIAGSAHTAAISSQLSELHKIFDKFDAASEGREETEGFVK